MNGSEENVQIRHMAVADLDQVAAIAESLPDAPRWPEAAYWDALNPESTPRRIALVSAGPGTANVRGYTVAHLVPPEAELEAIAVEEESQRRGVGRQLFDALVVELLQAGVCQVRLEVRAGNHIALAFYRSLGFGKTGIRPRYYADPIEDAVLMRLRIS